MNTVKENIKELEYTELIIYNGGRYLPTVGGAYIWFVTESLLNYSTVKDSFMDGWNDASENQL